MNFLDVKQKVLEIIPQGKIKFYTAQDELLLSDGCLLEALQPCWVVLDDMRFPVPGTQWNKTPDILEYVRRVVCLEDMQSFKADSLLILVNSSYKHAVFSDLTNTLFVPFSIGSNKIVYGEEDDRIYIAYMSGCGVGNLTLQKVENGYEEIASPVWLDSVNSEIDLLHCPISSKMPVHMLRARGDRDYWGGSIWISSVSCHAAVKFNGIWVPVDKNWLSENHSLLPHYVSQEYSLYLNLQPN